MVGEADSVRERQHASVSVVRGLAVVAPLGDPGLEQRRRKQARQVPDRLGVPADLGPPWSRREPLPWTAPWARTTARHHGSNDLRGLGGVSASSASAVARSSSPNSASASESVTRARADSTGLQDRLAASARARLAGLDRGVEVQLLGRQVAEEREQLDPQRDRRVVRRGRA